MEKAVCPCNYVSFCQYFQLPAPALNISTPRSSFAFLFAYPPIIKAPSDTYFTSITIAQAPAPPSVELRKPINKKPRDQLATKG